MAVVKTTFTSEDKDVAATMEKLRKQLQDLGDENRRQRAESRQAAGESKGYIHDQIASLKSMALGYLSINSAISAVVSTQRDHRAAIQETIDKKKEYDALFSKGVASTGDFQSAPEWREFIAANRGTDKTTTTNILKSSLDANTSIPRNVREDLVTRTGRLSPTLKDPAQFAAISSKLYDLIPGGTSINDLTDLTAKASDLLGEDAGSVLTGDKSLLSMRKLRSAGMSVEQSIGWAIAGKDANVGPGVVGDLAEALERNYDRVQPTVKNGRALPFSPAEQAQNTLAALSAKGDRAGILRLIQSDPAVAKAALGGGYTNFSQISPSAAAASAQSLREAQSSDYAGQKMSAFSSTAEGKSYLADQQIQASVDQAHEREKIRLQLLEERERARELVKQGMSTWQSTTQWGAVRADLAVSVDPFNKNLGKAYHGYFHSDYARLAPEIMDQLAESGRRTEALQYELAHPEKFAGPSVNRALKAQNIEQALAENSTIKPPDEQVIVGSFREAWQEVSRRMGRQPLNINSHIEK